MPWPHGQHWGPAWGASLVQLALRCPARNSTFICCTADTFGRYASHAATAPWLRHVRFVQSKLAAAHHSAGSELSLVVVTVHLLLLCKCIFQPICAAMQGSGGSSSTAPADEGSLSNQAQKDPTYNSTAVRIPCLQLLA